MAPKICMNIFCLTKSSAEWKRGWMLGSGAIASLCYTCGSAYEKQIFCETFHTNETGWRDCTGCGKLLHCGCIASLSLIELLDTGGTKCIRCTRSARTFGSGNQKLSGPQTVTLNNVQPAHLNNFKDIVGSKQQSVSGMNVETDLGSELQKREGVSLSPARMGSEKPPLIISSPMVSPYFGGFISPGGPSNDANPSCVTVEEREENNTSSTLQLGKPSSHLSSESSTSPLSRSISSNTSMGLSKRIPRPPVEGQGHIQKFPRYWPRITDQELQQISGDPNCTVVPLFEKVLSASDAGRTGRLILPKSCAEAYFPPISQPEGIPLKLQDIRGKEWVFQFRFWPNNNSRMYVLEGVTPCIQSMQLQAGDTVIFNRIDPGGKLLMASQKVSRALQSLEGSTDTHINGLPKQTHFADGILVWNPGEMHRASEGAALSSVLLPGKKKCRNIGSKRLHIHCRDIHELKLTQEEVQDMLRVPANANPNIVMVEDYEIEEYKEPPVLGKWSIFIVQSSGILEQWTQCDNCLKWRRLPVDVLLPPRWTCGDNTRDQSRSSCSCPDDLTPWEIKKFLQLSKGWKKKKAANDRSSLKEQDLCGLEALKNAATTSGENPSDSASGSASAAITKHPRHRPGCSCILNPTY